MPRFSESDFRAADIAACRTMLRSGSRTFHAASYLLPRRVREPASALYAFCRLADDSVDIERRDAAIERLQTRLDRVYREMPEAHPTDRAMVDVVTRFAIPKHLPAALIEGLAWDKAGRRYQSIEDLHAYSARVAGTVGVMMALLMGVRSPTLLARAADLGVAMQLTNIARDVGEDAAAGRIYLPLDWLAEVGIDPEEWLAAPRYTPELGEVVARLLGVADGLYARADAGILGLPVKCRPGILAARLLYAEIGEELRRNGLDSVARRTVVPAKRKLKLLASVAASATRGNLDEHAPCLEQARFLVEGVAEHFAFTGGTAVIPWWDFSGRAIWVIELFARLEQRRVPQGADEAARVTA
jgi:phytoene synthase